MTALTDALVDIARTGGNLPTAQDLEIFILRQRLTTAEAVIAAIQYECNQVYDGESGGLMHSIADILRLCARIQR